ncbi:hypothetical protein [Calothrix rhizosoleniae]|uniref:hypothetical protein n=1 Tax=Calothrix rhizosoleniae TaxID=888997 RepID=UPI001F3F6127|nr:hypothetical protein [Calothrix rhizosoleniae]
MLTDYSEANYYENIFTNADNNTISEIDNRGYDKSLLLNHVHDNVDNTVSKKPQERKNKKDQQIGQQATSKVNIVKLNEFVENNNATLQASQEQLFVERTHDISTNTSINDNIQHNSSITEDITPNESSIVNHDVSYFQESSPQNDLFNQDNTTENTELISEKESNLFTSESSTLDNSDPSDSDIFRKTYTNEYILPINNDENISSLPVNQPSASQENGKKQSNLDSNISHKNRQKQELVDSQSFNHLSDTENISENIINPSTGNESINSPITDQVSHTINDSIRNQDDNIQESISNSEEISISDVTQIAEKPLEKITSDSNNQINLLQKNSLQRVSDNSKSQVKKQTTSETSTNKPVSGDNFVKQQTFNQLSETENVSENLTNSLVANQPVNSPTAEEISNVINDSIINQDDNIQESITNSEKTPISDVTQIAEKPLEKIISDSNNQINLFQKDSIQGVLDNSKSQVKKQITDKKLTYPSISDFNESEIQSATTYEPYETTDTTDLELQQISDDFHNSEKSIQEISHQNKPNLTTQTTSDISTNITNNHELTLIKSDVSAVLPKISPDSSIQKQTDIKSSETKQSNNNYAKNDDSIKTEFNLEKKQKEITLPIESNIDINTDISNHENLPEDLLESDSSNEIPIIDPDVQINPTKKQNRTNISKSQLGDKSNINQKKIPQGYATGGRVTESTTESKQKIASSDTVSAMLTPGEFVVNAQDTQKNIDILEHINSGGIPEQIIQPSLEKPSSLKTPKTSLQRKEPPVISSPTSKLLTSSPLGLEVGEKALSLFNSPYINQVENTNNTINTSSIKNYSSPNLIFRKQVTHKNTNEVPSQWSNVEELLNSESDDFTTVFNFGNEETNSHNSVFPQLSQTTSDSVSRIAPKHIAEIKSLNQGGEVTSSDISRKIEPVSETIQNPLFPIEADRDENEEQNTEDLEVLANEIYLRLRQRLEIERERQGVHYGRLPW